MIAALWPLTAAALEVTNANDSGAGSLRAAINNTPVNGSITFSQSAFPPGTVTPIPITTAALPTLTRAGVTLDGGGRVAVVCAPALPSGNGLTVDANDITIIGMTVTGCPGDGIRVSGLRVRVGVDGQAANDVHDNDQLGVLIVGNSTTTADVEVRGGHVADNCLAPTNTCAGIGVKKGSNPGAGPIRSVIVGNVVEGQDAGGHGIGILAGDAHLVEGNVTRLNAGAGVGVAANVGMSAAAIIRDNDVSGNGTAGVLLGARSGGSQVVGNVISGNGGPSGAGIEVFGSDDQVIEGNRVFDNAGPGITIHGLVGAANSPAERVTVRDNVVGLDPSGAPAGNGGDGIHLSSDGAPVDCDHAVSGNVVSDNGGNGVTVYAPAVTLWENTLGLDVDRTLAVGNAGWGVLIGVDGDRTRLDGRATALHTPNYVAANALGGVAVYADDVTVADNVLGWNLAHDAPRGNGADGIRVAAGADVQVVRNEVANQPGAGVRVEPVLLQTVSTPVVEENVIAGNGGAGLVVVGVTGVARWSRNAITDNGTCALSVGTTVNDTPNTREAIPLLSKHDGMRFEGTYSTPGQAVVTAIEVFADDGSEAGRFLGLANFGGGTWSLSLGDRDLPVPSSHRVSAVAQFASGASSRLAEWCGDGCPLPGAGSCEDGDDCTTDTCSAGTCSHPIATGSACTVETDCLQATGSCTSDGLCAGLPPTWTAEEGTPCVDDDPCSGASSCDAEGVCRADGKPALCDDGNPCTEEGVCDPATGCPPPVPREVGFRCEDGNLCLGGETCDAFANCTGATEPWVCPEQTGCNACGCDPQLGCLCEGICGDGHCGPDDLAALPDGPDADELGEPCPECLDGQGRLDDDGDGFPNVWEANGVDIDCDVTTQCAGCPLGIDFTGGRPDADFVEGRREVFLEIDHMAPGNNHAFDPPDYTLMIDAFDRQGIRLVIDPVSDQFPYHRVTMPFWGSHRAETPYTGSPSWRSTRELRRDYGDVPRRRGVYHYGILANRFEDLEVTNTGVAEGPGDEFLVTFAEETDEERLNTILHEIGHNLGLDHGGDGEGNGEVNYTSVMNYEYQFTGLVRHLGPAQFGAVQARPDYSWARLRRLDEQAGVDEQDAMWASNTPIAPDGLYAARWTCPPPADPDAPRDIDMGLPHTPNRASVTAPYRKMDLNCDGDTSDLGLHHSLENPTRAPRAVHTSGADWGPGVDDDGDGYLNEGVQFDFQRLRGFGHAGAPVDDEPFEEQTPEEAVAAGTWWAPVFVEGVLGPGCEAAEVPLSGAALRVPLVLFGAPDAPVTTASFVHLAGSDPVTRVHQDLDDDGLLDLWVEYRPIDLARLSATATRAPVYAELPDGRKVFWSAPITRVSNPADSDGDGLHDACDACPSTGHPRGPDGCPP